MVARRSSPARRRASAPLWRGRWRLAARGWGCRAPQQAARGVRLGLLDVDADALARVAETLPGAVTEVADVRDRAALDTAIEDVAERLGGLDIGVGQGGDATRRAAP